MGGYTETSFFGTDRPMENDRTTSTSNRHIIQLKGTKPILVTHPHSQCSLTYHIIPSGTVQYNTLPGKCYQLTTIRSDYRRVKGIPYILYSTLQGEAVAKASLKCLYSESSPTVSSASFSFILCSALCFFSSFLLAFLSAFFLATVCTAGMLSFWSSSLL